MTKFTVKINEQVRAYIESIIANGSSIDELKHNAGDILERRVAQVTEVARDNPEFNTEQPDVLVSKYLDELGTVADENSKDATKVLSYLLDETLPSIVALALYSSFRCDAMFANTILLIADSMDTITVPHSLN